MKIKAASDLQLTNRAERTEPMYEDVTHPLLSVSAINTQKNVAYGVRSTLVSLNCQSYGHGARYIASVGASDYLRVARLKTLPRT